MALVQGGRLGGSGRRAPLGKQSYGGTYLVFQAERGMVMHVSRNSRAQLVAFLKCQPTSKVVRTNPQRIFIFTKDCTAMRPRKQRIDPMVGVETFEQCRQALMECIAAVEREDRELNLNWLTQGMFWHFREQMMEDADCLRATLQIGRELRLATGPGRVIAEREFLHDVSDLARRCINRLEPLDEDEYFDLVNLEDWDEEVRPIGRLMQILCAFAEETVAYKARVRDCFAGERRRMAWDILKILGRQNVEA